MAAYESQMAPTPVLKSVLDSSLSDTYLDTEISSHHFAEEVQPDTAGARIAVYDDMLSAPRVIEIAPAPLPDYMEKIAAAVYEQSHAQGGSLPYTVIREIAENFIHAGFQECTVSIMDHGDTLRFCDQGPGILKKDQVLKPGFSSATAEMKRFIRGVGSGLPIVSEYLTATNGSILIEDNAVMGTVVTISLISKNLMTDTPAEIPSFSQHKTDLDTHKIPKDTLFNRDQLLSKKSEHSTLIQLKQREIAVLKLLLESGMLGVGDITKPLGISAPTATRIFQNLEALGMVEVTNRKKRILSNSGFEYIQNL